MGCDRQPLNYAPPHRRTERMPLWLEIVESVILMMFICAPLGWFVISLIRRSW